MAHTHFRNGFRSWGGFVHCDARTWVPAGLTELQEVIQRQGRRGRVRMVGGGFSVSPLVPTEGCLVSTERLGRVLRFEPDAPVPFIDVEAGMTVWQLVEAVAPFGLRPIMPSLFAHPTLAGLMAVGGHGVGRHAGCFADGVDAIGWIDAAGQLHHTERGEAGFEALTTSLGCLGAIYSLRVRLEPDYRVRVRQRRVPCERLFGELEDLLATHEAVELFVLPNESEAQLLTFDRTNAPCTAVPKWPSRPTMERVGVFVFERLGRAFAKRSPRVLYELTNRMTRFHLAPRTWVDWASTGFHFETYFPKCRNCCFAFSHEEAPAAMGRVAEILGSHATAGRYPLTVAVHARFTGASGSWLSPAYGRPTAQIDLVTHLDAVGAPELYEEVEEAWLELPSARAHWAKLHAQPHRLAERYPRLPEFEAFRASVDPHGVFLNDYLENRVGLGRATYGQPRLRAATS